MQSKPKPESDKLSSLFPTFNPLMRGVTEAAQIGEPRAAEPGVKESNLYPKPEIQSNLFGTDALEGAMRPRPFEVGLSTREDVGYNWFTKLIGIDKTIQDTRSSQTFQMLGEEADRLESQGWAGMYAASKLREGQAQVSGMKFLWSVADFEERPRKAFMNILGAKGQHEIDKLRNPRGHYPDLGWADYRLAIKDGFDGVQYKGSSEIISTFLDPAGEIKYQKFIERHPKIAKYMGVNEAMSNFAIGVAAELVIGKAVSVAGKGGIAIGRKAGLGRAFAKFMPSVKITDSLDDVIQQATESIFKDNGVDDLGTALAQVIRDDPDVVATNLDWYKQAAEVDIPGAETVDDVFKGLLYRQYIHGNIGTKAAPEGFFSTAEVSNLIDAMTFGKKKLYNELSLDELQDIALEMEAIKNAPLKFRNGFVEQLRRKSYGPPVNTFSRLGLERPYARMMEAYIDRNAFYNEAQSFILDAQRGFKKRFRKSWKADNPIDMVVGRIADQVPIEDWPDDIAKLVTPDEIKYLEDFVTADRELFLDELADLAEFQGLISSDPAKIAAGVPPRLQRYYRHLRENVVETITKRIDEAKAAGKRVAWPPDYDMDKLFKRRIPTKDIGEFIARDPDAAGAVSYAYTRVRGQGIRNEATKLFIDAEGKRMKAAIDALPITNEMRGTATTAAAAWIRHMEDFSYSADITLNKAFNTLSRRMERVVPLWEARERSFQNFAQFVSRRVDQGLLMLNPRPTIRNLVQSGLAANLYGNRATLWGYQQLLTPGGRKLLKTSKTTLHRGVPVAAFDITNPRSFQKLAYLGIGTTDKYFNVAVSYLSGWRYYMKHNTRARNELIEFASKRGINEKSLKRGNTFADTLADALDAGMFKDARQQIDFRGIALTQWEYSKAGATPLLRTSVGKFFGKYSSWTQYMWGAHMPQLVEQMVHGKDIFGMTASPSVRWAFLQFIAKGAMLKRLGNELGIDMSHLIVTGSRPRGYIMGREVPVPISPAVGLAVGGTLAVTAGADAMLNAIGDMGIGAMKDDYNVMMKGWDQFAYSLKTMAPMYGVGRQAWRTYRGEQGVGSIFWPTPREKAPAGWEERKLPGLKGIPSLKGL